MRLGKFPTFFLLLGLAALTAAVFGALHHQLSYSVGPSYFEALKFPQAGVPPEMGPRLAAALIGAQTHWPAGLVIVLPGLIYGLIAVPRAQSYLAAGIGAIGLIFVLATLTALLGLVGGIIADATGLLDRFLTLPEGPVRGDFLRAGFMHDAGYVAAALGVFVTFWPMRRARSIDRARGGGAAAAPEA
jgi:hypothetical protein